MSEILLQALALVFVIEGLMPLLFPKQWKETFLKIASLTEGQVRFVGLVAILIGTTFFCFKTLYLELG